MVSMNPLADEVDDRALLQAWRSGDVRAGNELFRRHFKTVYNFFRHKVDTGHKDFVQRTFLGCVESRDRIPDDVAFRAYLLGIAHHQLLRHVRKKERENRAMAAQRTMLPESVRSPSRLVAVRGERKLLLLALRTLALDLQIVVELYYWQEFKVAEIADITDVAPGTVKSRLSRARDEQLCANTRLATSEDLRRSTVDNLDRWVRSLRPDPSDSC
jgi:RNA polymerase sigma factor (sigma-70 family)